MNSNHSNNSHLNLNQLNSNHNSPVPIRNTIAHILATNTLIAPLITSTTPDIDLTFLDRPSAPVSSNISHNEIISTSFIRPPLTRIISNNTSSEDEFDLAEREAYLARRPLPLRFATPPIPILEAESSNTLSNGAFYYSTAPLRRRLNTPEPSLAQVLPSTSHRPTTNGYRVPVVQPFRDTFASTAFLYPAGFPQRRLASEMLTEENFQIIRAINLLTRQLNENVSLTPRLQGFVYELPYEFLNIITSCFAILLNNYHQYRNI